MVYFQKNSGITLLDSNENSHNVSSIVLVYDAFRGVLTFEKCVAVYAVCCSVLQCVAV